MRIEACTTDAAIDDAITILQQLWTDADTSFIREFIDEEEYHLFGLYDDNLRAVAGCSIQRVLHHRTHAWIHDLVVDQPHRSAGYGSELLSFVTDWARSNECAVVALAATLENDSAGEFYEDNGMQRWGYVFEQEC